MTDGNKSQRPPFSLGRWSERKLEAARQAAEPTPAVAPPPSPMLAPGDALTAGGVAMSAQTATAQAPSSEPELPPVESLTFDSDFRAFLQPKVEEAVRRAALKRLFRDPHFNAMDGLDVYIDDYSIPSPVPPEMLRDMLHARITLDPPTTRINAEGHVEDVPAARPSGDSACAPGSDPQSSAPCFQLGVDSESQPGVDSESKASKLPPLDDHR